jgi:hypothetical protein
MVLSYAKLLHSTRSKQLGKRQETNHANRSNNNIHGNNLRSGTNSYSTSSTTYIPIIKWTGTNMVIKKEMRFNTVDYAK